MHDFSQVYPTLKTASSVYHAVGVSPSEVTNPGKDWVHIIEESLKLPNVVALGEIGLDYYRDLSPHDIQQRVFREQLDIAVEKKLPVVIHTRDSFEDTVKIIEEYNGKLAGGIFHCFPGTVRDAYRVIDLGFHVSVGGVITFPKAILAEVAAKVPLEYLLMETDCPYLTPVPYRGKTNQPAYIRYVRDRVAELREIPTSEVEKVTDRNCQKVYHLVDLFEG